MDIRTRANIHMEGEGFDLLPELKQLYLANGRCLRKALSYTDEQHINRVIFVDCTQKPEPCVVTAGKIVKQRVLMRVGLLKVFSSTIKRGRKFLSSGKTMAKTWPRMTQNLVAVRGIRITMP